MFDIEELVGEMVFCWWQILIWKHVFDSRGGILEQCHFFQEPLGAEGF